MRKANALVRCLWVLALGLSLSLYAKAGTILVTSAADAGPGTLREAVAEAAAGDVIEFVPQLVRIDLTGGEILIDEDLEIRGPQAQSPGEQLVIDAGGRSRLFRVAASPSGDMPEVLLSDLALTGGSVQGVNGGAILNGGRLTLLRCSVYGNEASAGPLGGGNGGGVANSGTLKVEASTLHQNRALAGASGSGSGNGGGIYNAWGGAAPVLPTVLLLHSTLSGNAASVPAERLSAAGDVSPVVRALVEKVGLGGGLFNDTRETEGAFGVDSIPGMVEVEHSTIADNSASSGGGIGNLLLLETGADGPGESLGGALFLDGSIVGGNLAAAEGGTRDVLGDGLALDSVVGHHLGNLGGRRNILGQDAGLMPLADNGGPTLTHAPKAWSPAVNMGPADCEHPVDQTGASRVVAGRADVGACESVAPPLPLEKGVAAAYTDRSGDPVRIVLTGPGHGYATASEGADAVDIVLRDTTNATELRIETSGHTTLRRVQIEGAMGAFRAPDTDLLGSMAVTGGIKTLVLRDVLGYAEITMGTAPGKGARVELRNVADLVLRAGGRIRAFSAESWEGHGDGAHDLLMAAQIGTVAVRGRARKLRVESAGDVDEVEVGAFEQSCLLAGATPGLIGLADPRTDLPGSARLGKFTVTGAASGSDGSQFIDGIVAARTIGKASLGVVSGREQDSAFGLSANSIKRLRYSLGGQAFDLKNLEDFGDSVRGGSFTASLDSTEDLGFTFGALDDTRSDLWLPGVAIQHLGLMFQHAAEDHCRFVLVPGDFATSYMGLCMSDATCQLFDPNGTISQALSDIQYPEFVALAALHGYTLGGGPLPTTLYPVRGNHECYLKGDLTRSQWTKYVGQYLPQNGPSQGSAPDQNPQMDERGFTYSFKYGNALFLGIDEYAATEDKDNGFSPPATCEVPSVFCNGWLTEQLAAFQSDATLQHLYAFGHSPLYVVKMDTSMDATALTRSGRDAFVQNASGALELYFCGHEHFYDHTIIGGTSLSGGTGIDAMHQVLVGTGGAEIDRVTQDGCTYSASYVRDPARQYYHNPEVPASGPPDTYIGYNVVTVSGSNVSFLWKSFLVTDPCYTQTLPVPCGLCPNCTVSDTPVVRNSWSYSVQK